jgi:MFS family permease
MEICVSSFALIYMPLMPAIAKDMLGLGKRGLGQAMSVIGIGAMASLIGLMMVSHKPIKALIARIAMTSMGVTLILLSFTRTVWLAFPLLVLTGAASVAQFNTTNTLFQLLAPEHLRGRVIAMHIWALSGLGPLALPVFGWLADRIGVPETLLIGGSIVTVGASMSWVASRVFEGVP